MSQYIIESLTCRQILITDSIFKKKGGEIEEMRVARYSLIEGPITPQHKVKVHWN